MGEHEPPDLAPFTQRVLMLIDPRAQVHATTGILPTATLGLPPAQGQATASVLDLSLFAAPVLRGAGGLAIPTPAEAGYAISYVEVGHDHQGHAGLGGDAGHHRAVGPGGVGVHAAGDPRGLAAAQPGRSGVLAHRRRRPAGCPGRRSPTR